MALAIDLINKTAIVTGVASGIGLGIAKMLAKAGCNIVGCDIHSAESEGAKAFAEEVKKAGMSFLYVQTDVTNKEALGSFVAQTIEHFGQLDILVSCAGRNVFEGAVECSDDQWNENINLNLASHWHLCKLAQPHLLKSKNATIIIVTSNHAYATIPGCFPYNVAKTALTGLVKSLAIEWGPHIRTVGIAPGFIDTKGNQQWFDSFSDPQWERQRTIDMHPVKKLGTVDEIGGWCAFLASEYATFASGTTYLIDGGRSALLQD